VIAYGVVPWQRVFQRSFQLALREPADDVLISDVNKNLCLS